MQGPKALSDLFFFNSEKRVFYRMGGVSEPCFHGWMSIGLASETNFPAMAGR
jgi:hypothetical protein